MFLDVKSYRFNICSVEMRILVSKLGLVSDHLNSKLKVQQMPKFSSGELKIQFAPLTIYPQFSVLLSMYYIEYKLLYLFVISNVLRGFKV